MKLLLSSMDKYIKRLELLGKKYELMGLSVEEEEEFNGLICRYHKDSNRLVDIVFYDYIVLDILDDELESVIIYIDKLLGFSFRDLFCDMIYIDGCSDLLYNLDILRDGLLLKLDGYVYDGSFAEDIYKMLGVCSDIDIVMKSYLDFKFDDICNRIGEGISVEEIG